MKCKHQQDLFSLFCCPFYTIVNGFQRIKKEKKNKNNPIEKKKQDTEQQRKKKESLQSNINIIIMLKEPKNLLQ